jgi:hypothetical protein
MNEQHAMAEIPRLTLERLRQETARLNPEQITTIPRLVGGFK